MLGAFRPYAISSTQSSVAQRLDGDRLTGSLRVPEYRDSTGFTGQPQRVHCLLIGYAPASSKLRRARRCGRLQRPHHDHHGHATADAVSLNRVALSTTVHCLTGCAIGEVLGMVIGTALGWGNAATIVLAVGLAFFFGYALTMLPLLRAGMALGTAARLAFASDTSSITIMEFVDNAIMLARWMRD